MSGLDKNRPYCAILRFGFRPRGSQKDEVSETAGGFHPHSSILLIFYSLELITNVECQQGFTDTRLKYMQPELVQTGACGVCALAILKTQDVSNFG